MDAVVTATTTMAQGPEGSTSTDTRRQGEGKTSYNCKRRKTMEEFVTVEYMKYLLRCCTEDGYGYGAGGGEDDHHGYAGIALIMVCE